jgi:hypothetical protein
MLVSAGRHIGPDPDLPLILWPKCDKSHLRNGPTSGTFGHCRTAGESLTGLHGAPPSSHRLIGRSQGPLHCRSGPHLPLHAVMPRSFRPSGNPVEATHALLPEPLNHRGLPAGCGPLQPQGCQIAWKHAPPFGWRHVADTGGFRRSAKAGNRRRIACRTRLWGTGRPCPRRR